MESMKNIKIQKEYPSNTSENISYVYYQLKKITLKKFYFLHHHFTVEDQC